MRRLLLVHGCRHYSAWPVLFLLLLLFGCGGSDGLSQVDQITHIGQPQQVVYVVNESGWPEPELHFFIAAQNVQLQRDFRPRWAIDAVLVLKDPPDDSALQLRFLPDFSRFDKKLQLAGVHGARFTNHAYVNLLVTGPEGSTSSTGSHETLEMLANPTDDPKAPQICDPVAPYAYGIGPGVDPVLGQNMADFVFPAFFQPGAAGPYDYMGLVTRQGVPAPGGFIFDPTSRGGR